MQKLALYISLLMALSATQVHAYIGPGAGAGTIAVVVGVIASFFLALVAIIWYPLKRFFRGRKAVEKKTETNQKDIE